MKKIVVLFLAVLSLGVVSCSSDDDSGASIHGKWYFNKVGFGTFLIDYDHECTTQKDYFEFLASGILNEANHDVNCEASVESGTWAKTGNQLSISFDDEDLVFEIVELKKSTLKLIGEVEGISVTATFTRN